MIEKTVDNKHNLTIQKCTGKLTKKELLNTAQSFFNDSHTLYAIWDFSLARMTNISPETIKQLAGISIKRGTIRLGCKTAIVVPADFEYGLARIFQTMTELGKALFETKVLISLEEAKRWLIPSQ